MIRKIILFVLSPFCAVCIMVVPDVWTIASRQGRIPETLAQLTSTDHSADIESRAWHGDWSAIEEIGESYARVDVKTPWQRSVSTWNRMLLSFLLPICAVTVVFGLYAVFWLLLFQIGWSRGLAMNQMQKWRHGYAAIKGNSHFFLTLWMSASYYLYRWWSLAE